MGNSSWDDGSRKAYANFTHTSRNKSTDEIYSSRRLHEDLDPTKIKVRESRDSDANPESTPIIIGLDVTGSMGFIADEIARKGLGVLFTSILDHNPVPGPHVMFMGLGDANHDEAPLQVSQFEADKTIIDQLTKIYLEHGGGGNNFESYNLAWYFARYHTVHDAMMKRNKRGYLFTVGDEEAPHDLTRTQIEKFISSKDGEFPLKTPELLKACQQVYDVYHIIIEQGDYAQRAPDRVRDTWTRLLGQHVIALPDYTKLSETIVSAIAIAEGANVAWDGETADVVHAATKHLPRPPTTDRPVIRV